MGEVMVDVYWETTGEHRYLRAGDWDLDPDSGVDTIESLRRDVEELSAAIAFLEAEKAKCSERAAKDQRAGYQYATTPKQSTRLGDTTAWQRKPFYYRDASGTVTFDEFALFDKEGTDHSSGRALLDRNLRESRRFQVPYMNLYAADYDRRAGRTYATGGEPRD
jgi:hypothetical protein